MTDTEYAVLDLFAGLGGFSAAFDDSPRWDVTTVEIDPEFDPDVVADVFDLRPSDFDTDFDVILASPPCTTLSLAGNHTDHYVDGEPNTESARDHVALAHHTVGLIGGLTPSYWFVENPRGRMRRVLGRPTGTVTYCQYGFEWQKRTDLWGDHPPMTYRQCPPGADCHLSGDSGFDVDEETTTLSTAAERSYLPYDLSDAIREACEQGLDGNEPTQKTVDEWV